MMWFFAVTFVIAVVITAIAQGMKNWAVNVVLLGRFILIWLAAMPISVVLWLIWFVIACIGVLVAGMALIGIYILIVIDNLGGW